jgi:hypothetical protein
MDLILDLDKKYDIKNSNFYQYLPRDLEKRKIKEWDTVSYHNLTITEAIQKANETGFEIPTLLDFWDMNKKDFDRLEFNPTYHWCKNSHVFTQDSIDIKLYMGYHTWFQYPVWRAENEKLSLKLVKYEY